MNENDERTKLHGGPRVFVDADFSASVSPLGIHPAAAEALHSAALHPGSCCPYPDPDCSALRALLAGRWGCDASDFVCGAGAADVILLSALVASSRSACAVVMEPAFSEYGRAASCASLRVVHARDAEEIRGSGAGVVYLASPSNPLGEVSPFDEIRRISGICEEEGAMLVLDSCFSMFSEEAESVLRRIVRSRGEFPSVVIVDAFTKFYGMAGLRFGYALCLSERNAKAFRAFSRPWAVGSVTQSCAGAVLRAECRPSSWVSRMRSLVSSERARICRALDSLGLWRSESRANFVVFRSRRLSELCAADGAVEFVEFRGKKISIRSCSTFRSLGPDFHRVSVRSPEENSLLIDALISLLSPVPLPQPAEKPFGKRAKVLMVQGTMSDAGKSLVVAALCRIFAKDGFRVAPFKSQNMALNSGVTADGKEMGRAQILQAEACAALPDVRMNPILLKPTSDSKSQVIVCGEAVGDMRAADYFSFRKTLVPKIMEAFESLASENDIIVIEGAGSPAEINLREGDIVNMGLAELVDAPVLLVGDIDRGGVFASLYGTYALVGEKERDRIKGFVVNKFRGDISLLSGALSQLENLTGVRTLGVVPFMKGLSLDAEDSLSFGSIFVRRSAPLIRIIVIALPFVSNFTDIAAFTSVPFVSVEKAESPSEVDFGADMIVVPGTKNTVRAMEFMEESGLGGAVRRFAEKKPVAGICGGYQILGRVLDDSAASEGGRPSVRNGLGLLPVDTVFGTKKTLSRGEWIVPPLDGFFSFLSSLRATGYEVHQGASVFSRGGGNAVFCAEGNAFGTYVHGFFDEPAVLRAVLGSLASAKGCALPPFEEPASVREKNFRLLEESVRASLDIGAIYEIMGISREEKS